jgi:hypothetical protein
MRLIPLLVLMSLLWGCSGKPQAKADELRVRPNDIEHVPVEGLSDVEAVVVIEPRQDYPDGDLLRMKFVPGQTFVRMISGTVQYERLNDPNSQPSSPANLSVRYTTTTKRVQGDIAIVEVSTETLTAEDAHGSSARDPDQFELVVDDRGRIIRNLEGILRSGVAVAFIPFPNPRVKPGSEWSLGTAMEVPVFEEMEIIQKFVYRGTTTHQGKKAWQIDTSAEGGEKIDVTGTYFFDATTGHLIQGSFTLVGYGTVNDPSGKQVDAKVTFKVKVTTES